MKKPSFAQLKRELGLASTLQEWMDAATELVILRREKLGERLALIAPGMGQLDHLQAGLLWFHIVNAGRGYPRDRWIAMAAAFLNQQLPSSGVKERIGHLMVDGWNFTPHLDHHMRRTLMVLLDERCTWEGKTRQEVLRVVDLPLLRQSLVYPQRPQKRGALDDLMDALGPDLEQYPVIGRWVDACQLDGQKPEDLMKDRLTRLLRAGANLEARDEGGYTALEAVVRQGWESEHYRNVIDLLLRAGARWQHIALDQVEIEPLRDALLGHPMVRRARLMSRVDIQAERAPGEWVRAL